MMATELFGVCVRVIGLLAAIYGIWMLPYGIAGLIHPNADDEYQPSDYLIGGFTLTIVGLAVLFGARFISDWAY